MESDKFRIPVWKLTATQTCSVRIHSATKIFTLQVFPDSQTRYVVTPRRVSKMRYELENRSPARLREFK